MNTRIIDVTVNGHDCGFENLFYKVVEFSNGLIIRPYPEDNYSFYESREDLNNQEFGSVYFEETGETLTFTQDMFSEIFQNVAENDETEIIPSKFYEYWTPSF
jgi:hypothetical protein